MGQNSCLCFKVDNDDSDGGVYEPSTAPRSADTAGDHSPPPVATIDGDVNLQRDERKRKKFRIRWRKGRRAAGQGQTDNATETDAVPTYPNNNDEIPVQPVTSEAEVLTAVDVHQTPAVTEPGVLASLDGSVSRSNDDRFQTPELPLSDLTSNVLQPLVFSGSDSSEDFFQTPELSLSDLTGNIPQPLVCSGSDSSEDFFQTPELSLSDLTGNIPQPLVCSGSDSSEDFFQTPELSLSDLTGNIPQPLVCSGSDSSEDFFQTPELSLSDLTGNIPQPLVCSGSDSSEDFFQTPELSLSDLTGNIPQPLVCSGSDSSEDFFQTPELSLLDLISNIPQIPVLQGCVPCEDKPQGWFMPSHCGSPTLKIQKTNSHKYEIGDLLGKGAFGEVYEGTRLSDGLEVAVKFVKITEEDNIKIPGHPEPLPREVALQILVHKEDKVPEIIQLLDWQIHPEGYILVLERLCPCENLLEFLKRSGGRLQEDLAVIILRQTTVASEMCCRRGVFHRDIKLENILINRHTFDVKLTDFGSADLLKSSDYRIFMGTTEYFGPEYTKNGRYKAKPTTVYSLGVLLFALVRGRFPKKDTLKRINQKTWDQNGLSTDCCSLLQACLQENPKERIQLEEILKHKWFRRLRFDYDSQEEDEEILEDIEQHSFRIEEINSCYYKIGKMLGKGGFGQVHEGTRLSDGLKVAVKFVTKSDEDEYFSIPGHPEPLMQEVALHILINKGDKVPEIIELLDWQEHADRYVLVLESFAPCKDLSMFLKEDQLDENIANKVIFQATRAAYICCKRGVLHRDIKLQNLLINTDTFEVKLIDFGCGDLLKESGYDSYTGTEDYICPEFDKTGEYHGKPATVYSLGVLLFVLVCRRFPSSKDFDRINQKIWCKDGFSEECCSLVQACLQENPKERIQLRQILKHKWFQTPLNPDPGDTLSDSLHSIWL